MKSFVTALGLAAAFGLASCSSMGGSEHTGSTSVAPAATGTNSSATTDGPPASGTALNPPSSTTPR